MGRGDRFQGSQPKGQKAVNITSNSRAALHAILDISLSADPALAKVQFMTSAQGNLTVAVFAPDFQAGDEALLYWFAQRDENLSGVAEDIRQQIEPENLARIAAEKREKRVETLRQQLAEAEAAK